MEKRAEVRHQHGQKAGPESPRTLFSDERQTPSEDVHEVWKPVRMGRGIKLSDVHDIGFVFKHSTEWRGKGRVH